MFIRSVTDPPAPIRSVRITRLYASAKDIRTRIISALRCTVPWLSRARATEPERPFCPACRREGKTLPDWIRQREGEGFREYLSTVWQAMQAAIQRGLPAEGILPGGLEVERKAKILYEKRCYNESADVTMNRVIAAYAYAVSEENASENIVVTAPTCGSCGVIPAVFYYMQMDRGFPEEEILDALAVAGMIGNVIRTNASISGAECGCQAEIGSGGRVF